MDPFSILQLVEVCATLTLTAGKLAVGLKALADNYKHAALTFRCISTQCNTLSCAVRQIQIWMEGSSKSTLLDDATLDQLGDSLECAHDVIEALEEELLSTSSGTINNFWEKVNVIWNHQSLKSLDDAITKQIIGLGVILEIMKLPTPATQKHELDEKRSIFTDSRISVLSIIDPETSTIRAGRDSSSTMQLPSTIDASLQRLPTFDFEEMLFSSRVYLKKRSRKPALPIASEWRGRSRGDENHITASDKPLKMTGPTEIPRNGDPCKQRTSSILICQAGLIAMTDRDPEGTATRLERYKHQLHCYYHIVYQLRAQLDIRQKGVTHEMEALGVNRLLDETEAHCSMSDAAARRIAKLEAQQSDNVIAVLHSRSEIIRLNRENANLAELLREAEEHPGANRPTTPPASSKSDPWVGDQDKRDDVLSASSLSSTAEAVRREPHARSFSC